LRLAWANHLRDPIPKITRAKWTGVVAQAVEYLLSEFKLQFHPNTLLALLEYYF
jgi:hypothetical protein